MGAPADPTALPGSALVVGGARSGVAAAAALARRGARVRLHDTRPALGQAAPDGVEVVLGDGDAAALVGDVEVLVKSPGVPRDAPVVAAAVAAGVPVWSEVELGYRLLPPGCRVAGVTGTNGKTTTVELVGAMLRAGGVRSVVAGNVGVALTAVAGGLEPGTVVACELSSFQLEDVLTFRCAAAALLNITPDHLDRHGTLEAYRDAKLRIFERQGPDDVAVLNADDPAVAALGPLPGAARIVRVHGTDAEGAGWSRARLRGDHNRQNVACAAAVAAALGVEGRAIRQAVEEFRPVSHRLEPVGVRDGVAFWNDSKATNVDATLKALTAFETDRIRLILGGSDKGADFVPLARALAGRIRGAYLVGPAGVRLRPLLDAEGVPARVCHTLAVAVASAAGDAEPGDHVLLAPACASFDEFRSYEERGDRFRALARDLGAR